MDQRIVLNVLLGKRCGAGMRRVCMADYVSCVCMKIPPQSVDVVPGKKGG